MDKPQTLPQNLSLLFRRAWHHPPVRASLLADIHGQPMIVHVWKRARMEKWPWPVLVACDTQDIVRVLKRLVGKPF